MHVIHQPAQRGALRGHKNIAPTVRYTELAPDRFLDGLIHPGEAPTPCAREGRLSRGRSHASKNFFAGSSREQCLSRLSFSPE